MDRGMRALRGLALALACAGLVGCGESSRPPEGVTMGAATPAGYWEGTVSCSETPMQDHARTLTRKVDAEVWFTVRWDPTTRTGVAVGEANAVYDATLTVKNLPKVTAPVPGGNVKFEPEVGGTLTQTDNKRRFPVVGVLSLDPATGRGQLWLAKGGQTDTRSESERNDDTARGVSGPDASMEFTLRADPGVSGGLSGDAGSIAYDGNTVSGGAGGMDVGADVGGSGGDHPEDPHEALHALHRRRGQGREARGRAVRGHLLRARPQARHHLDGEAAGRRVA